MILHSTAGETGFHKERIYRSVPRSHPRAQELEILNIPKLPRVMFFKAL